MAADSYSTPDTSSGGSWLSDVGTTLGNIGTSAGKFLTSPGGAGLAAAGVGAGVGLYEAGQASSQAKQLAGQIQAQGAPAGQLGAGTIGQLTGGPSVGGPMGQAITGQTGAANTLAQTAQQYGSGNLTSAQNLQIQQQVAQQRAQVNRDLAASGNLNSSARDSAFQQIDNNAAMLAQQMVQGNVNISTSALGAVTNTYNSLIGNALKGSALGLDATSQAVQTQIQSDQQISQYVQQLMKDIAGGLTSTGKGDGQDGQGQGSQASGVGGALGQAIKGFFGGGGAVANSGAPSAPTTGYQWGGGPGGSDYAPGVSAPDVTPTYTAPSAGSTPDWLGTSMDGGGLLADAST